MVQGSPFSLSSSHDFMNTAVEISRDGKSVEMDVLQVKASLLGMILHRQRPFS